MNIEQLIEQVIEMSRVLAWPLTVGIIIYSFRTELGELIKRIAKINFPGGSVDTPQQSRPDIDGTESRESQNRVEKLSRELKTVRDRLGAVNTTIEQYKSALEIDNKLIAQLKVSVELQEFRYLDLFYSLHTKRAIAWFRSELLGSTKDLFMAKFELPTEIPNHREEKETIFNVLLQFGIIENSNSQFKLSEKGLRFTELYEGKDPYSPVNPFL